MLAMQCQDLVQSQHHPKNLTLLTAPRPVICPTQGRDCGLHGAYMINGIVAISNQLICYVFGALITKAINGEIH